MYFNSFYSKGIFIICLLSFLVFLLIYVLSSFVRNEKVYVAATIDKEQRMNALTGPRILLIGGSNLALGMNSRRLSKAIGLQVANMGVHAGLGFEFMLNEVLAGLRKDDIAIISFEYFLSNGDKKLQAQLIDINDSAYPCVSHSLTDELERTVQQLQRCLSGSFYRVLNSDRIDPIYRRSSFTREGDLTAHFGKRKPVVLGDNNVFNETDFSQGITSINEFSAVAKKRGASVYFVFPAYAQSAYGKNQKVLDDYFDMCKKNLECHVLGRPIESVLSDQYFFDTIYHLDSTGIEKRTDTIINLLKTANVSHSSFDSVTP